MLWMFSVPFCSGGGKTLIKMYYIVNLILVLLVLDSKYPHVFIVL